MRSSRSASSVRGSNVTKQREEEKLSTMATKQSAGLNPLDDAEISDAEKNTAGQRFGNIGLNQSRLGANINTDLESRYQRITSAPQYSESSDAFKAQMALRKSRQTSTRLGG